MTPGAPTAPDLARLAYALAQDYRELHGIKYARRNPPEARVMAPVFRPTTPAPIWVLSTLEAHESALREMVSECMTYLKGDWKAWTNGMTLCEWIQEHSEQIITLEVSQSLADLMTDQRQDIRHKLNQQPGATTTTEDRNKIQQEISRTDITGTAAHLAPKATAATGKNISRDLIRKWGERGHITTTTTQGEKTYSLAEIITHATTKTTTTT